MTRYVSLALCLVVFVSAAMFLTYGGRFVSTDEVFLFDLIESVARRGNLVRNLTNDLVPMGGPFAGKFTAVVAVPWFLVVERAPGVGMVHGMLVFNNLVTSATAGLVFFYALRLGYSVRVGVALGMLFALGTIAWPYAKTLFQEPLLSFFLLLAAYGLESWRQSVEAEGTSRIGWLALGMLAAAAAQLTKDSALLAAPALLLVAVPGREVRFLWANRRRLFFALVVMLVGLFAFNQVVRLDVLIVRRLASIQPRWILDAVAGFLVSPGKSLFVYSPVLLLGLASTVLLAQRRAWRQALVPWVVLACFVGGYAVLHNERWFGGLGWGPRYMVPLTGFLLLPALPVIEYVLARGASRWARAGAGALLLLSVGIQVVGTLIPTWRYPDWIAYGEPWNAGVWDPAQTHLAVNMQLLSAPEEWGAAWWHVLERDVSVPLLCLLVMALAVVCMRHLRVLRRAFAAGLVVLLGGVFHYTLIRCTARDELYFANYAYLFQMLDYLNEAAAPDEVVLLNNPRFRYFFYNFNKLQRLFVVPMPSSPGEQSSPDQPAEVISENPERLVQRWIPRIIHQLADQCETLWLFVDSGPFISWSVRPVEWWMALHYFPIYSHDAIAAQVRAVRYSTVDAPEVAEAHWPRRLSGARFGETFTLLGYDLIRTERTANLSLLWRLDAPPAMAYNVGLFLLAPDGTVAAERHSAPVGGFGYTGTGWEPGESRRDNHALLPPPGEYTVRLIVYNWDTGERLPVTGPEGEIWGDALDLGTVAIE